MFSKNAGQLNKVVVDSLVVMLEAYSQNNGAHKDKLGQLIENVRGKYYFTRADYQAEIGKLTGRWSFSGIGYGRLNTALNKLCDYLSKGAVIDNDVLTNLISGKEAVQAVVGPILKK